jgi:hypothetical protein
VTKKITTLFTCERCGDTAQGEAYSTAPMDWRCLAWNGGYSGDESREAHYCKICSPIILSALDVLLKAAA